jgi:hypothetical protein
MGFDELHKIKLYDNMKKEKWYYTPEQHAGIMKMASFFSRWVDVNFYGTVFSATGGDIARWLSEESCQQCYDKNTQFVLTKMRELYLMNRNITDVADMKTTL